jgi:hypothetical protein
MQGLIGITQTIGTDDFVDMHAEGIYGSHSNHFRVGEDTKRTIESTPLARKIIAFKKHE